MLVQLVDFAQKEPQCRLEKVILTLGEDGCLVF